MTGVDSERSTSSAAASALTGLDMLVDGLRELGPDRSVSSVMQLITGVAVASLAGADEAGLTLLTADRFTTKAPTSDVPTTVDALQYEHGGPCLDAVLDDEDGTVIQVDDLRTEQRWPGFASAAGADPGPEHAVLLPVPGSGRADRLAESLRDQAARI